MNYEEPKPRRRPRRGSAQRACYTARRNMVWLFYVDMGAINQFLWLRKFTVSRRTRESASLQQKCRRSRRDLPMPTDGFASAGRANEDKDSIGFGPASQVDDWWMKRVKILEIDLRVFLKVSQISGTGQVIEFHSSVNSRLSYMYLYL